MIEGRTYVSTLSSAVFALQGQLIFVFIRTVRVGGIRLTEVIQVAGGVEVTLYLGSDYATAYGVFNTHVAMLSSAGNSINNGIPHTGDYG